MLLTPWWVLTAAHCQPATGFVFLGNLTNWNAPHATIARSFRHPSADVQILQLAEPLYPQFANGVVWSTYKRDLYRGDIHALASQHVDVYGYGATEEDETGIGILRYAWFRVDRVTDTSIEIDGHVEVHEGDSGAAVLTPARYGVTATDAYRIAAVLMGRQELFDNPAGLATHAAFIAPWVDSIVGDALKPFNKPAQIMTILGVR